jgi:hypothetical protein
MTARYSENFSGKTKHSWKRLSEGRYTEENRGSVDTAGMDCLVREEWRSSYCKMTHHGKNVMDDNLIFILQQ